MRRWWLHLMTILLYAALTVLLYSPHLETFSTHAIGHPAGNTGKEVRGMWAGMNSIAERGYVTSEIQSMNFPDGGSLFSLQQGGQWLGMLFRPFLNVTAIHNLLYLLNTLLAAIAAFLLAREVTGHGSASVVAGAIYGFSATALTFPVASGVTETSYLFPLPLILLFTIRSIRRRSLWNPVFAAFFLVFQTFVCWSYGIVAAVMLFFVLILLVASRNQPWAKHHPFLEGAVFDWAFLRRVGLFIVIGAVVSVPLFLLVRESHSGGAVYDRATPIWPWLETARSRPRMMDNERLSFLTYLAPGRAGLVSHIAEEVDWLVYASYAGWVAILLAAYAAFKRRAGNLFLLTSMGLFMLISMGQRIVLGVAPWASLPNPIYVLFWLGFPAFSLTMNSPDRFSIGFQLLLAVTAAGGLAALFAGRLSKGLRWLVGACLALCIVLETLFVSPVPWPFPQTESTQTDVSRWLRDSDVPGAVLDLPLTMPFGLSRRFQRGDVFIQQVYHGRAIPQNYLRISESVSRNVFFRGLIEAAGPEPVMNEDPDRACDEAARLGRMGFAFLVYRPDYDPELFERTRNLLDGCFEPPREVGGALIYAFSTVPSRPSSIPRPQWMSQ